MSCPFALAAGMMTGGRTSERATVGPARRLRGGASNNKGVYPRTDTAFIRKKENR